MGPIGVQEMIAIFVIALILFGPKKLPELGRTLGKALSEFRRAKNELKSTFETHLHELERETRLSEWKSSSTMPDYSSPTYPQPYDEYGQRGYDSSYAEQTAISAPVAENSSEEALQSRPVADTVPRGTSHADEPVPVSTEQDRAV